MNEKYWKEFYKNRKLPEPSNFAFFCLDFIEVDRNILEVGGGDFRDSIYLKNHSFCEDYLVIEPNNKSNIDIFHYKGTLDNYLSEEDDETEFCKKVLVGDTFDYIYSRWFIHAVSEETEDKLIDFAVEQKATLMLEFRILGDNPDDTHERRLIDLEKFTTKLLDKGFIIKHLEKGYGLSKVGDDDPYLARVIAEYNG